MKFIFTCLLLGVVFGGFGQGTFKVAAFAPESGSLNQLTQLNDGSFVGVGELYYNNYIDTGYLVKTDAKGNVLGYKRIPTTASISTITKTNDGGFAVCGYLGASTRFIKFNADMTVQWEKDYSTDGTTAINKVIQAVDSSFLLVGSYFNNIERENSAYIIKASSNGSLQFAKRFHHITTNTLEDVYFNGISATTDGNYALLAEAVDYSNTTNFTTYVIKIDSAADILWSSSAFSDTTLQSVSSHSITTSSDGGLLISGDLLTNFGYSSYHYEATIVKFNNEGNLLWSKRLGVNHPGASNSSGNGVLEDIDSTYLLYGAIDKSINSDTAYMYIAKINASGELQWVKKFYPVNTGTSYTEISNLIHSSDGAYAACGDGAFYNSNISDYSKSGFIFKFDKSFGICTDSVINEGALQNIAISIPITLDVEDVTTTIKDVSASLTDADMAQVICSSSTLPLQLLSFNATLQNKSVVVQWQTANEVNTSYFIVERSNNATAFTAVQQVAAKGNSVGMQTYSTTDLQPLPGTFYYRLKEVDKDGKVTYSSIVPVTVLDNGVVVISPNPVRDAVHVVMQSAGNSNVTLQIVDINGNILATQKVSVATGRNEIMIPAASLTNGVYVLKVIENNTTQTIRFVKE